ncbi:hypothetical protein BIV57_20205 [Mangrovactinospora gilvigrisea]|uniref:Zinc finger CGNR domain-containing protein n=1 Tax=Mangrovactinospora gilvigrisea TaxID=1428644 RepID=A0A1J7BAJ8_9ACTN|nr:CGNR zinc finger domain-containing protein [Mangrovactinospora gilvigrisea]OIV35683.1 hypothetical protein BIV57_20205 [Mangrovactinospora gilvigrisea]
MANEIRPVDRLVALANLLADDPAAPPEALAEVLHRHGEPGRPRLTAPDAAELRSAVDALMPALAAADADEAAEAVNALLAAHAGPPRLTRHDGTAWHLHVDATDDPPWETWLLASSALGLAVALAEHGRPLWGRCAAEGCGRFWAGAGRGSPQRYCSPRCATRTRVAAHRRRA